jgi:hypothetical protein
MDRYYLGVRCTKCGDHIPVFLLPENARLDAPTRYDGPERFAARCRHCGHKRKYHAAALVPVLGPDGLGSGVRGQQSTPKPAPPLVTTLPNIVFKYTRRAYAEDMVARGRFRIGTLHEYRRVEAHGSEIGDVGEGTKQVVDAATGHWRDVTRRPNLAQRFIAAPPDADIRFENVGFQENYDVPDCFLYCVTARFAKGAMQAFEADTCVEIIRPGTFFAALDAALRARHPITRYLIGVCQYGDRTRHVTVDGGLHPAFLKPHRYAYQHEIRALWEPQQHPIEAVFVESLPAAACLRIR